MILMQAKHLTKRFLGRNIFTDVNLQIKDQSRIALIGRNGAGKSTLVKMLLGVTSISSGQVFKKDHLKIGYLAQNTGLHADRSIIDEMRQIFAPLIKEAKQIHHLEDLMGQVVDPQKLHQITHTYDQLQNNFQEKNGYGYEAKIRGVLKGFGFTAKDYHRNINDLSGGQQSQLALAKLLLEKEDLLILDEPTNHIDVKTLTWLENYLQSYSGALLVISHDRYFLDKIAHEILYLSQGKLTHYKGNYTAFTQQRKKRMWLAERAYENQQAKIRKDKAFIKANIARNSTATRAKSRRQQLSKIKVLAKPTSENKVARFRFHIKRNSGVAVLDVDNLTIGYPHQEVANHIHFEMKRGQVIGILGPNGIGKSTLLKTITKEIPPLAGTMQFGTGVSIGYYDQKQATLHPAKTVLHELWDEHPTTDEGKIRSILGSFLFSGEEVDKKVADLSGGEKARLQLTKLSMQQSNFLLLDEPTNHLDIASREVLEQALKHFAGTILFVSHDRYFINQIASEVLEFTRHGTKLYLGNYDYYVAKKAEEQAEETQKQLKAEKQAPKKTVQPKPNISTSKAVAKQRFQDRKARKHQKQKLQRTLQQLEKKLTTVETKKRDIELEMAKKENAQNGKKLADLQAQLDKVDKKDEKLGNMWTKIGLKLENF